MARKELSGEQIEQRFFKKKPSVPAPIVQDAGIDEDRMAADMALMREQQGALTVARKEQNTRVATLAQELNYQGSTDVAVLENSARDAIRRIGMAIFELGGYLLLLKEGCGHGTFGETLERLGINQGAAGKYMAVTRRFANSPTSANLEKLGFSKMVELLPLDDSQADDLVSDGQTGELALDDVARMSVKELRAAVRKERQEVSKQKSRAERQEAVNAELHEEARLIKREPPGEFIKRLQREAAEIQADTMGKVRGDFRRALEQLNECGQDQSLVMAGMVGQLIAELTELRDEFNLREVGGKPEWEKWSQAQEAIPDLFVKAN
jgi:hypothetical protein